MQFGDFLCPCGFVALCGLRLVCSPPSLHLVDCERVSCVRASSLSGFVRVSPAHLQTAVDELRCSCQADSVFTSGFGAEVEGTKREYASSRDWSWGNDSGRAFLEKNEREG